MSRRRKNRRPRPQRAAWLLQPTGAEGDATDEFPGPFACTPLQERMSSLQAPVEACPEGGPDHPTWAW